MNNKKMLDFRTIAVDFDGTLCYSKWPGLGQPNLALIEYLQEWKRNGNITEIIESTYLQTYYMPFGEFYLITF